MTSRRPDLLSAVYTLSCTAPGCSGTRTIEQNLGVNLRVGDTVPLDPTNPIYGRCPQCQRHNMKVTKVPPLPAIEGPRGFAKVPEK